MSWELTQAERLQIATDSVPISGGLVSDEVCKAIATAAVKKYQTHLASACGDDPCVGCSRKDEEEYCTPTEMICSRLSRFLNLRAGYAKGLAQCEAKVKAREQEIVDYLWSCGEIAHLNAGQILEAWLKGKK